MKKKSYEQLIAKLDRKEEETLGAMQRTLTGRGKEPVQSPNFPSLKAHLVPVEEDEGITDQMRILSQTQGAGFNTFQSLMDSPPTSIDRKLGNEDHNFMEIMKGQTIELDEEIQLRKPALEILMRDDNIDIKTSNQMRILDKKRPSGAIPGDAPLEVKQNQVHFKRSDQFNDSHHFQASLTQKRGSGK